MSRINYLVVALILILNQICRADVPEQIDLIVYYESKCSDSRVFVEEQLLPAVGLLHRYLKLKLVPWGKADSINDNGDIDFKCQHGPSECLGNMVQDCALEAMAGRSDHDKVAYVACEMRYKFGTVRNMTCVEQANIPVNVVKRCVSSARGVQLQLESEYLTKRIRPTFIPTVTIGEIFNQDIQDSSMEDLIGTLCSMFKNRPVCARHYNNRAMIELYD